MNKVNSLILLLVIAIVASMSSGCDILSETSPKPTKQHITYDGISKIIVAQERKNNTPTHLIDLSLLETTIQQYYNPEHPSIFEVDLESILIETPEMVKGIGDHLENFYHLRALGKDKVNSRNIFIRIGLYQDKSSDVDSDILYIKPISSTETFDSIFREIHSCSYNTQESIECFKCNFVFDENNIFGGCGCLEQKVCGDECIDDRCVHTFVKTDR